MRKDKIASPLCAMFLASMGLVASGCGSDPGTPGDPNQIGVTPTPIATPTVTPTPGGTDHEPGNYNLERYAIVTGSSKLSDNYAPDNVADGHIPAAENIEGYIWLAAGGQGNNSWVEFEWNSQVRISQIRLWDNPQIGHGVEGGRITFDNIKNPTATIDPITISGVPDDGKSALVVTGPSSPVTKMQVRVTNARGSNVGLAHVTISGYRVEEDISYGNIASYAYVAGASSTYGSIYVGKDTGPYRSRKVQDGVTDQEGWISNGNGDNAFLELRFDRSYEIDKVTLYDRLNPDNRFTLGQLDFRDVEVRYVFSKAAEMNRVTVDLDGSVNSKRLFIDLTGVTGAHSGLAEVEVFGRYSTP